VHTERRAESECAERARPCAMNGDEIEATTADAFENKSTAPHIKSPFSLLWSSLASDADGVSLDTDRHTRSSQTRVGKNNNFESMACTVELTDQDQSKRVIDPLLQPRNINKNDCSKCVAQRQSAHPAICAREADMGFEALAMAIVVCFARRSAIIAACPKSEVMGTRDAKLRESGLGLSVKWSTAPRVATAAPTETASTARR